LLRKQLRNQGRLMLRLRVLIAALLLKRGLLGDLRRLVVG
jgi:hypothetical protein